METFVSALSIPSRFYERIWLSCFYACCKQSSGTREWLWILSLGVDTFVSIGRLEKKKILMGVIIQLYCSATNANCLYPVERHGAHSIAPSLLLKRNSATNQLLQAGTLNPSLPLLLSTLGMSSIYGCFH